MSEFFMTLSPLDRVFMICAAVGGLTFTVRMIMMFAGGGDSDMGGDMEMDVGGDSDTSFQILTVEGLTVFFLMFGIIGLCLHISFHLPAVFAIAGAFAAGMASVWLIAKVMILVSKLQSSGTIDLRTAIGQEGTVYLRIPEEGTGKVNVTVQGRLKVMEALSNKKEEIKTEGRIIVVDVVNNVLVVEGL